MSSSLPYYICDNSELVKAFNRKYTLPDEFKSKASLIPPPRAVKPFRTEFAPDDLQSELLSCEQNSSIWYEGRMGSLGASDIASCVGWSPYKDNITLWAENTGRISSKHLMFDNQYLAMDRGHFWEKESGEIYSIVMGMKTKAVGILFHHELPYVHVSADLLVENLHYGKFKHNDYCTNSVPRYIGEIKNTLFKGMKTVNLEQNTISTLYLSQLLLQNDTYQVEENDFIVHHKVNELYNKPDRINENQYYVGETRITKFIQNHRAASVVKDYIQRHVQHCIQNRSICWPILFHHAHSPDEHIKSFERQHILEFQESEIPSDLNFFLEDHDHDRLEGFLSQEFQFPSSKIAPVVDRKVEVCIEIFDRKTLKLVSRDDWLYAHKMGDYLMTSETTFVLSDELIEELIAKIALELTPNDQFATICLDFPPILIQKVELDKYFVMVPQKEIKWITTLDPDQSQSPLNETEGLINGTIEPVITHHFHTKPIMRTLSEMFSKNDHGIELDQPFIPTPTLTRIKNPWLQQLMKQNPGLPIRDIIEGTLVNSAPSSIQS